MAKYGAAQGFPTPAVPRLNPTDRVVELLRNDPASPLLAQRRRRFLAVIYEGLDPVTGRERRLVAGFELRCLVTVCGCRPAGSPAC